MKLCFIVHSVHPTTGGSRKYFFEVIQELKKQGHQVTVVAYEEETEKNINADDLVLIDQVKSPFAPEIVNTLIFGFLAFLRVNGQDYDLYCFESGFMGIWAILFKLTKKPLISFSMRYSLNFIKLNIQHDYHKITKDSVYTFLFEIFFFIYEILDIWLSDRIIVLNKEAKDVWIKNRVRKSKLKVIPYGVDLDIYKPIVNSYLEGIKIEPNDKLILHVGHLDQIRNPDVVIKSFALLLENFKKSNSSINLKMVVVGSGPLKSVLKDLSIKLKINQHIIFLPWMNDQEELNKIYNLGKLLVLAQVPGTVAIQAIAAGTPVVALKNKSGLLGAVDEEILSNFILLNSADPKEIAGVCYNLLNNPELLEDISERGKRIIWNYSWNRIAKLLAEFLNTLI